MAQNDHRAPPPEQQVGCRVLFLLFLASVGIGPAVGSLTFAVCEPSRSEVALLGAVFAWFPGTLAGVMATRLTHTATHSAIWRQRLVRTLPCAVAAVVGAIVTFLADAWLLAGPWGP
jgi:hypothetical protein